MSWTVYALTASVLFAAYGQVNRHFGLPGVVLNAYRGAVPFVLLSPCFAFVPLPGAWQFYALTALNGLVISYSDARLFDAAAKFGSAQALRLQPLVLIVVFLLWAPLDPAYTQRLLESPALLLSIGTALATASVGLFFMTRTAVTMHALRFYLPAILATGLIDPINKLTTRYAHGLPGALCYAVFTSLFVFVFLLPRIIPVLASRALADRLAELRKPGYARAGLMIGCISIAFNVAKNLAMAATPNPAFVTAVIFCSGLWATLYAHLQGEPDEYSKAGALAFIVSAIALMVLSTMA